MTETVPMEDYYGYKIAGRVLFEGHPLLVSPGGMVGFYAGWLVLM